MPRFIVEVPLSATIAYTVYADNAEHAKELVLSGEGSHDDYANYDEDQDTNNWDVYADES